MRRCIVALVLALALPPTLSLPLSAFGQEKSAEHESGQETPIRSGVDLISVYFTVRDDKKRLASELAQDKFSVSEDGRSQTIKFFAHHSDVILNVGVLLDTGTNMSWILAEEAQASRLFVQHVVRSTDLGFVLSYASRVETVQLPTSDVALLMEGTIQIGGAAIGLPDPGPSAPPRIWFPGGGTVGINGKHINMEREARLYDAIGTGTLRYLKGEVGRKAVVIVALSGDSRSESTMTTLCKLHWKMTRSPTSYRFPMLQPGTIAACATSLPRKSSRVRSVGRCVQRMRLARSLTFEYF